MYQERRAPSAYIMTGAWIRYVSIQEEICAPFVAYRGNIGSEIDTAFIPLSQVDES